MGIGKNFAPLIFDLIAQLEQRKSILTLGRITLDFDAQKAQDMLNAAGFDVTLDTSAEFDDVVLFKTLGFTTIESLDYSDFEGASKIFDLNAETLSSELREQFDVVLNAGTLEHVFRVDRGFANCLDMLREGGVLLSIAPMNNYVDHGFYQFSPTLFLDIAGANNLEVLASVEVRLELSEGRHASSTIRSIQPSDFGVVGALDAAPRLYVNMLRKGKNSTSEQIPIQAYYQKIFTEGTEDLTSIYEPSTYYIEDGVILPFEPRNTDSDQSSVLQGNTAATQPEKSPLARLISSFRRR